MFSFIYVWINGWVNNRKAGDLRRYRAHYDVTVMEAPVEILRRCCYRGHQATGPVQLDTAVHSWFGRIIRRTPRVPMRCPFGHRMGIFNVFHIIRDPYGARVGISIRTRKGIDTTKIGKNPTRVSYLAAWGPDAPYSPHAGCLRSLNPYGTPKLMMYALKLYGFRTGRQNSYGLTRGLWVDVWLLFKTGPGSVMWLGH